MVLPAKSRRKGRKAQRGNLQMVQVVRARAPRPRRVPYTDSAVRQYRLTLRNPFHPDAMGVRVVDSVCYPTTVSHLRFKVACTTTATGTFQAAILPFLQANMILNAGTATGNPGVYANNTSVSYVASLSTLKNLYSSFRVVAWGARVILTDANLTAKGVYTVAPVLLGGLVPGEQTLSVAATTTANIFANFNLPQPTELIASMPAAAAVNAQDLMQRGELLMRGIPYSVTAYNMKIPLPNASWSATTGFTQGGGLYASATGTWPYVEQTNANSSDGLVGYLLSVSGAPASTSEFSIEFIYHIEGVPQPSSGLNMASSPSPAGTTMTVEKILSSMHTAGEYFALGTTVASALGGLGSKAYSLYGKRRNLGYA